MLALQESDMALEPYSGMLKHKFMTSRCGQPRNIGLSTASADNARLADVMADFWACLVAMCIILAKGKFTIATFEGR
jgi:hypothetical protein